jgi:integrase
LLLFAANSKKVSKMKVYLRQRKQSKKGSISLYLEIYKGTQRQLDGSIKNLRDYKYLNLYLVEKPANPIDKQQNKEILRLAESIKAKTELDIKNGLYGFTNEFKQDTNFIQYFRQLAEKKNDSLGNYGNWHSTLMQLINFAGQDITFRNLNESFCEDFRDYLKNNARTKANKHLASNTILSYFNKFRAALNRAVKEKIIQYNPCIDIENPKHIENQRNHLTLDEVKLLAKTECRYEVLKRAFLFSCLTGLRWSDINKLRWREIEFTMDGARITFHQQKTKGLQYLDISKQALNYIVSQGMPDDLVFTGLKYSSYTNVELTKWMVKAGITKDITFHCARHTFAVLQLTLGTEIYTLSKLLGHSALKTTQVYSKIVDSKKIEAVNKIPDISI